MVAAHTTNCGRSVDSTTINGISGNDSYLSTSGDDGAIKAWSYIK